MEISDAFVVETLAQYADVGEAEQDELHKNIREVLTSNGVDQETTNLLTEVSALFFYAGRAYQDDQPAVFHVPMDENLVLRFMQFLSEGSG